MAAKEIVYFQLQPLDESARDFCIHLRPDSAKGARMLKAWTQANLASDQSYYDRTTRCRTIKRNGKYQLKKLRRSFDMVQGIPWDW